MEITTAFNYAALDAETRIVVQQKTGEIKATFKRTLDNLSEMGEKFDEVRALLRHNKAGGFEAWYESEGFKRTFVYGCMDVFNNLANLPENGRLTFDISALFALAGPSTPVEARTEVIERAQAGEKITQKVVSEVKEKFVAPRSRSIPTGVIASKPITRVNDGDEFYEEAVINRDEPVVLPQSRPPSNGLAKQPTMSNVDPIRDPKAGEANHLVTKGYEQTGQAARTTEDILKELQDLRTLNANQETAMKELAAENERLTLKIAAADKLEVKPMIINLVSEHKFNPEHVGLVMSDYGEAKTRLMLQTLITFKVKPHDFVTFSKQFTALVSKAHIDPAEAARKLAEAEEKAAAKKAAKIHFPQSVNSYQLHHLMEFYARNGEALDTLRKALGINTDLIHWDECPVTERREYIKLYQELDVALVNPDCYGKMIAYARSNWPKIPVNKIAERISEWKQTQMPAATENTWEEYTNHTLLDENTALGVDASPAEDFTAQADAIASEAASVGTDEADIHPLWKVAVPAAMAGGRGNDANATRS